MGKVALVTGSSSGIGLETVLKENISKSDRNIVFIISKICSNNNNKNG